MSKQRVRKAIIPAAGMGTRFLPATKSMPKEMLPIIDKPVLQYVIEEAIASGITDILIVTGRGKRAIENHFDYSPELEAFLVQANKREMLEQIRDIGEQASIFYIRQKVQRGLGDAIRLGQQHMGDEPFAVLLGDTIINPIDDERPGLRQLLDVYEEKQASVVAVQKVPHEWVSRYGIVAGKAEPDNHELVRLDHLVEKPAPGKAPSNLAIAGRYVFTPEIFSCLNETTEGVGGEIQLTDAMNMLAQREAMYALDWHAKRYDIGNRVEYAKCFLDFALRREDTRDAILEHLIKQLPLRQEAA
ncbi:MAG: UTP--glucose-1-phosphate uridylyltransferase GalU [Rhodothermales bacterium]